MPDVTDVIHARSSSRGAFDPDRPVPDADLEIILEAARAAPTAHNMQNYEIVVVDDPKQLRAVGALSTHVTADFVRENFALLSFTEEELKRRGTGLLATTFPAPCRTPEEFAIVARYGGGSVGAALNGAPCLLVLLYDPRRRAPASEHDMLGMASLGCVLQNMWLAATARGLDMQVLSMLSATDASLKTVLEVPSSHRVAWGLRLGYAREKSTTLHVRRNVDAFVHRNAYGAPFKARAR